MADWVHCNKCACMHNGNTKFYLTNCTHILCQLCIQPVQTSSMCPICKQKTKSILLSKDTDKSILEFFKPISDIFSSMLKKCQQAVTFQIQQHSSLIKLQQKKYQNLKQEMRKMCDSHIKLTQELQLLRDEQKQRPHHFHCSTPVSSINPKGESLHMNSSGSVCNALGFTGSSGSNNSTLVFHSRKPKVPSVQDSGYAKTIPNQGQFHRTAHTNTTTTTTNRCSLNRVDINPVLRADQWNRMTNTSRVAGQCHRPAHTNAITATTNRSSGNRDDNNPALRADQWTKMTSTLRATGTHNASYGHPYHHSHHRK